MSQNTEFKLLELKIEVTNKCNLSCVHCSNNGSPSNNKSISLQKCFDIIDEAYRMGVKKVAFSGGDPLIWPYINELINFSKDKEMISTIFTSGYVENAKERLLKLLDAGLAKTIFSLYSSEKSQHERITRKRGSYNITIEAIRYACEIGLDTELHFVAMSYNYNQLDRIVKLAQTLGVHTVSVLRFAPQGRGSLLPEGVLSKKQNLELRQNIFDLRNNNYTIRTGTPYNFLLVNENRQCSSGINKVTIDPNLRLYPCDGFKNIMAEEFVGTLNFSSLENESLANCWYNSPYLNSLRDYLTSDFDKPCDSCKSLKYCMSGCTAQKVLKHNKLIKCIDPDCLM